MAKFTNEGLIEKIADAIKTVKSLKDDRADTNAEIASVRENMNALGISKKAFDMGMKYADMDPDDRQGFDVAYALVRKAAGLPMQDDLFAAADRRVEDEAKAEAAKVGQSGKANPDAAAIDGIWKAQDADKTAGKKVLEAADGSGRGAIN